MNAVAILGVTLGMRHGADPDHLAAIDGLTRLRPRRANGIYFALGHGTIVILLAVGFGRVFADHFAFLGPWLLILIGTVNVWNLVRGSSTSATFQRPVVAQPFLLGMLLAAGFETASQLSALILAGRTNAWLLGCAFAAGMILVDGLDGLIAASTQALAHRGNQRGLVASRMLGAMVVVFAFGLGLTELAGIKVDRFALPLGVGLFVVVCSVRVWARSARPTVCP